MKGKDFDKFVYLKLDDNYSNAFLTTNHGEVFYRDWKEQKRPEYVAVEKGKYEGSFELKECVRMGMLIRLQKPENKEKEEPEKRVEKVIEPEPEKKEESEKKVEKSELKLEDLSKN